MAEYTAVALQAVEPGNNILFTLATTKALDAPWEIMDAQFVEGSGRIGVENSNTIVIPNNTDINMKSVNLVLLYKIAYSQSEHIVYTFNINLDLY